MPVCVFQEERSQRVLRSSHRSSNVGQGSSSALDSMANSPSPSKSDDKSEAGPSTETASVEVHPRKRKIKASKESSVESVPEPSNSHSDPNPNESAPATNCYEMFLNIRRQVNFVCLFVVSYKKVKIYWNLFSTVIFVLD